MDVYMKKNLHDNLPAAVFPYGYEFKNISREQGYIWEDVMDAAFGNYRKGDFEYIMVENYSYLPERVFILFDELNHPCGTASAWSQPYLWGDEYGYIIFVGVIPSHRSKHLGKEMVLSICETIKNRGQKYALLDVESVNFPAIKSYLNAGFQPCLTANDQKEIWYNILDKLKIEPNKYSFEIIQRMDNPHPLRPYLLDLREMGYDVN